MKLTEVERRALKTGPFIGPRPGSNLWAVVELDGIGGEVFDDLVRRGLLAGAVRQKPRVLVPCVDDMAECEVDCTHDYDLTPAGRAALEGRDG